MVVPLRINLEGSCFSGISFTDPIELVDVSLIVYLTASQLTLQGLNDTVMYDANIRGTSVAALVAMNAIGAAQREVTPAEMPVC